MAHTPTHSSSAKLILRIVAVVVAKPMLFCAPLAFPTASEEERANGLLPFALLGLVAQKLMRGSREVYRPQYPGAAETSSARKQGRVPSPHCDTMFKDLALVLKSNYSTLSGG